MVASHSLRSAVDAQCLGDMAATRGFSPARLATPLPPLYANGRGLVRQRLLDYIGVIGIAALIGIASIVIALLIVRVLE